MWAHARVLLLLLLTAACAGVPTDPGGDESGFPVVNPGAVVPSPLPAGGPWHHTVRTASSPDGWSFTLEPRGYGVTRPVRLGDGSFRMYAFRQPDAAEFVSLRSADGLAWTLEAGVRFSAAGNHQITDPFVTPRGDGSWLMVYKREARRR
ncbi:MAG: hypothetical protein Q8N53_15420 [Longimicrobiales bacterium]|nr:hypothetical protein [Longimicrobiales bacterium]